MTQLILYPRLSTRSRRAIAKTKHRGSRRHRPGAPYQYSPRGDLMERLMRETGWSFEEVYEQLLAERREILRLSGIAEPR